MVLIPLVNWRLLAFDEPAEVVSQEEDGHLYEDLSQQTAQPIAKLKDGTTIRRCVDATAERYCSG